MHISVSAPGKIILHGEHAVVYEKGAIAMSISMKTEAEMKVTDNEEVKLILMDLGIEEEWKLSDFQKIDFPGDIFTGIVDDDVILMQSLMWHMPEELHSQDMPILGQSAVKAFLYLYFGIAQRYCQGELKPMTISVSSELPIGAGMGSSAAFSVCLAAAILVAYGQIEKSMPLADTDRAKIERWAFQAEKLFHGQPSGIDNAVCTYGGAVFFQEGLVKYKISRLPPLGILLVNTGVTRDTKRLVSTVQDRCRKHNGIFYPIFEAIGEISFTSWHLLQNACNEDLSSSINELQNMITINQHLLNSLGVGHPKIDEIVQMAGKRGLAAKLTGAGGGGSAIVLIHPDTSADEVEGLVNDYKNLGYECLKAELGCAGVAIHYLD